MTISQNMVVSINYTLKNDRGDVLDSSEGRDPLQFIHGTGMIIPGLEEALSGREQGESLSVTVDPAEGYGEYDEAMIFSVPREKFQDPSMLEVGAQVQAQTEDGGVRILQIKSMEDDSVTLDANHPLAGEKLHFDVTVEDVREASDEELDHGHAH